jgi:stage IV sporulation protein B
LNTIRFHVSKKTIGVLLVCLILALNFSAGVRQISALPDDIYIDQHGDSELSAYDNGLIIEKQVEYGNVAVSGSLDETLSQATQGGVISTVTFDLFGIIPLKTVSVHSDSETLLIPGGDSIGVTLYTAGALVVGTSDILTNDGSIINPAKLAGLLAGDVIKNINGIEVENAEHMSSICNSIKTSELKLGILRDGRTMELSLTPVRDSSDGKLRMGIWVRDSTAGVGTLTFYDPRSGEFAALGHAITDTDTKQKLEVKKGEILRSDIIDVVQGEKGEPGELKGILDAQDSPLGSIEKNTDFGIYGHMYKSYHNALYSSPIPIAVRSQVMLGDAIILTTLSDDGINAYKCEIQRIMQQEAPAAKGFVIKITDEALLSTTGGIVQGMSGSPVIQNGRIVGAVTHVFINDPTRGYGMFVEWMLKQIE